MDPTRWQASDWSAFGQVGALAVAVVAGVLVWLQVRQGRHIREDQTRPYVIVDFEFRGMLAMIAVSNIGSTPATDIQIEFDQPLQSPTRGLNVNGFATFSEPIPMLAPGRKISVAFGRGPDFFAQNGPNIPVRYVARVSYGAPHTGATSWRKPKRYDDPPLVLDLQPFKYSIIDRDELHQISQHLRDIKQQMKNWTSGQRLRINSVSQAEIDEQTAAWLDERMGDETEEGPSDPGI